MCGFYYICYSNKQNHLEMKAIESGVLQPHEHPHNMSVQLAAFWRNGTKTPSLNLPPRGIQLVYSKPIYFRVFLFSWILYQRHIGACLKFSKKKYLIFVVYQYLIRKHVWSPHVFWVKVKSDPITKYMFKSRNTKQWSLVCYIYRLFHWSTSLIHTPDMNPVHELR